MKTSISLVLTALLMGNATLAAGGPQKHKPKHPKHQQTVVVHDDAARSPVAVHVIFSSHDARVIHEYYAPRSRNLPPGLQKKLARGGTLPPGWQKKMQPFPAALERELVVLPPGYHRGVFDRHAVIYKSGSPVIIDVTVLGR
jgi:hypothetical protein